MKIFAMCVVKNEADIIHHSINEAATWADKVIVYDNGSTDGTWQKVNNMKSSKIIAFKQDHKPYSDGLRADIFNAFKHELKEDDWWVIQDGDEIYDQSPRKFIENQSGYFHHINGKKIDFCFDLEQLDKLSFTEDFSKDIVLFTHYTPAAWSEPRAIRHRSKLVWEEKKIWPAHMGLVCENAINIRHYPLRSANQIKTRWNTRKDVKKRGGQLFNHWEKEDWRDYYSRKAKDLKKVDYDIDTFEKVNFVNDYRQGFFRKFSKTMLHRIGIFHSIAW